MSIEAKERDIKFLGSYKFIVPYFQRSYVWKKVNWNDFYDNFLKNEKPGFIGSIILKKQQTSSADGHEKCNVIDGQQRLTTLTIFLKALYDTMDKKDKDAFERDFNSVLYDKIEDGDDYKDEPRLELGHINKYSYYKVLMDKIDCSIEDMDEESEDILDEKDDEEDSEEYDRIEECYRYFYKRLSREDSSTKKNLSKLFFNNNIKFYVSISIDSDDDEQKVFDTLNTAGMKLTIADTVKNYLFNRVSELTNREEKRIESIYKDTWEKTFEKNEEERRDRKWNKEIVTGRISRPNIDLFLYCYAVIKQIYEPRDNIDKLTNIYKKSISNYNSIEDLEKFIIDLCNHANIFYKYFIQDTDSKYYKYSKEIDDILDRILFMKNTTFYPYILYILTKYKNDKDKLKQELHYIEKLIFMNIIYGNANKSKNYNKLTQQFIKNDGGIIDEINSVDQYFPKGLYSISNEQAKMLLFIIELYRRKDREFDVNKLHFSKDFQLEHIMPQKWYKNWTKLPTINDEGRELQDKNQQERYRKEKIYALGNMTILSGTLNNRIKNSAIDVKIEGDNKNDFGIKKYATLLITNNDIVKYYDKMKEKKIETQDIWTEKRINERTQELFKELKDAVLY